MSEEKKELEVLTPASQSIVDAAKRESHQWLNPETWRTMQLVAQTFVQSGAMPKTMDTAPKLMVVLQAGKEAGLQPLEAINSFYFVNGKVALYGDMAIAQVIKAGHKIEWSNCDDKSATIKITRGDNGASNEVTFTIQMAKDRGLMSNSVFTKYPENMLRFKAFWLCAKFIVPDALHGVKIKEIEEVEGIEEMPLISAKSDIKKLAEGLKPEKTTPEIIESGSLEEAINKEEEKPEEKSMTEKVLENFGGEVIETKEVPVETKIAEDKEALKNSAPQSALEKGREIVNKIKNKQPLL